MRRILLMLAFFVIVTPAQASIRAAFYYPWFPSTTFGHYTPSLGFYDSSNPGVQKYHVRWLQREKFGAAISSWWGQGTPTDQRVRELLRTTRLYSLKGRRALKWTIYYEPEGYGDPTVAQIQSDLDYLRANYVGRREWLRINDKPVIFVWASGTDGCGMADRWKQAAPDWHVVLKVFPNFTTCLSQPDSWHQYGPDVAAQAHLPWSYSISPGFYAWNEATPRLARDIVRWRQNVRDMVASTAMWKLVVSFSEWGEGTAVESGTEWESNTELGKYGDALANDGKEPVAPPSTDPVVAAAGDIAAPCSAGSPPANAMATSNLLAGATFVLTLGDLQYDHGEAANITNCYDPTWGRFKSVTKPSPGNHDWENPSGYRTYWSPTADYYAFDCGSGWRCYSLNSQVSMAVGSAQNVWLRNDLAANPRTCTLAYWHYPRYSSGNYAPGISSVQPLLDALPGVDVVLNGHDHVYERFGLRNGYRQFTVGTGGRSHYSFGSPQPLSEVRNATSYGVLKLTLHASSYDWSFVPSSGTFTDSGSDVCR